MEASKSFDSAYAPGNVKEQHKGTFYQQYVIPLTYEAKRLSLTLSETIELIEGGYEEQ